MALIYLSDPRTLDSRGKTLDGRLRVTVIAILTFIVAAGIVTTSTADWG